MSKMAVIGLGRFGSTVARALAAQRVEVLAVDRRTALCEAVADDVAVAVAFDATDRTNLEAYQVGDMDVVVVAIGNNFEASVLVTMHARELGAKKVVSKALNEAQEAVLRQVGADQVVKPEEDMGQRVADHLATESVVDFVELPDGFSLRRISVPDAWDGRTLAELDLLGTQRLNLVQIHRRTPAGEDGEEGQDMRVPLPRGSEVLQAGDRIDVIGPDKELVRYDSGT